MRDVRRMVHISSFNFQTELMVYLVAETMAIRQSMKFIKRIFTSMFLLSVASFFAFTAIIAVSGDVPGKSRT
jgi:hypothetical protein